MLHPSCLSVCPVPTVNSKTEKHTTFKLGGEVTHMRSDWYSSFEVTRLKAVGHFILHI